MTYQALDSQQQKSPEPAERGTGHSLTADGHVDDASRAVEREHAVKKLIADVERTLAAQGVTRSALADVSALLVAFAEQRALFSRVTFPPPGAGSGDTSVRYRLNPGGDGIALYLNSLLPGKTTIPHNHDTWAVIAAVEGDELNRVYRRLDDGSDPDRAELRIDREVVVKPGVPIAFLPDDIHSIHVDGTQTTLHLHIYGKPLEALTGRIGVELDTGRIVRYNLTQMQSGTQAVG